MSVEIIRRWPAEQCTTTGSRTKPSSDARLDARMMVGVRATRPRDTRRKFGRGTDHGFRARLDAKSWSAPYSLRIVMATIHSLSCPNAGRLYKSGSNTGFARVLEARLWKDFVSHVPKAGGNGNASGATWAVRDLAQQLVGDSAAARHVVVDEVPTSLKPWSHFCGSSPFLKQITSCRRAWTTDRRTLGGTNGPSVPCHIDHPCRPSVHEVVGRLDSSTLFLTG